MGTSLFASTRHTLTYRIRVVFAAVFLIVFFAMLAVVIVPPAQTTQADAKISIVAGENVWGNIAQQLGGPHVSVVSLISSPNADPHLYESNGRDAAAVAQANLVIVNGLGYDDFMGKLLGNAGSSSRQVITVSNVLSSKSNANPHLWYDIPRIPVVAKAITEHLVTLDPADATTYRHNLAIFTNSLRPLMGILTTIKTAYGGTPVAYTEPVPGYLITAAGLANKTPFGFAKSVEDGYEPSPADTQIMDALMTQKKVRVLFYNAQATSPTTAKVKALAQLNGIAVIGTSETMPGGNTTYQSWQTQALESLLGALQR